MINDNFSLMKGGLIYRLLSAMGALTPGNPTTAWVASLLVVTAFAPLLVLTLHAGTAFSSDGRMGLLQDYDALARYLLAMPLLMLAAPHADKLLKGSIRQLRRSGLVHADGRNSVDALLNRVRALRDSSVPELLCFALAVLPALARHGSLDFVVLIPDWRAHADEQLTPAGHWYHLVSMPAYRFVMLIWLWRFCLWCYLLWRLSRTQLHLHPAHPDGAGGLGFLGIAQERFAVLAFACGLIICGVCINHIVYLGHTVVSLRELVLGYVIVATLILIAPLLLLTPAMMSAKRHALIRYDALGDRLTETFDQRWRRGQLRDDTDNLLDQGDASALCDYSGVYANLASMSVVPFTRWNILWIMLYAAAPLTPLLFFVMSVDEIADKILQSLL